MASTDMIDGDVSTTAAPSGRRGMEADPPTNRRFGWAFAALLAGTALLYLWGLGGQGNANSFYAAAVQSSTRSRLAWLFAAVDAPGFITVDKPPADNWWMGLWARIFGFSSWSMLAPQAVLGVAAVALLVVTVRRWSGRWTGLAAGAVLAVTPVAVIMFRFNDPDALLVFLTVAAAYALVRAIDDAHRGAAIGWMVTSGALVGLAFLTKMGAALLVVPAFALVHVLVADVPLRRRVGQLLAGGVALLVSAAWYVALVEIWPASSRPWIGGSPTNSLLQLALQYNGASRLFGRDRGGAHQTHLGAPGVIAGGRGAGPAGHGFGRFHGAFGGSPGIGRLFSAQFGGQIAWLLPSALLALVALLWVTRSAGRCSRLRASAILWGGWLVTCTAVFSFMQGMVHPYYTVLMAPAVAALVALGAREAWQRRTEPMTRLVSAVVVAGTGVWSAVLLRRTPTFLPWLAWLVLAAGMIAAVTLIMPAPRTRRVVGAVAAVTSMIALFGGACAYALDTVTQPHPATQALAGPPLTSRIRGGWPGRTGQFGRVGTVEPALADRLRSAGTTWSAATSTTMAASVLELASGTSVMGLGGFSGSDPVPTLAQFQQDVAIGRVHYFVDRPAARWRRGNRGGQTATTITNWVRAHYAPTTIGTETIYDLSAPAH